MIATIRDTATEITRTDTLKAQATTAGRRAAAQRHTHRAASLRLTLAHLITVARESDLPEAEIQAAARITPNAPVPAADLDALIIDTIDRLLHSSRGQGSVDLHEVRAELPGVAQVDVDEALRRVGRKPRYSLHAYPAQQVTTADRDAALQWGGLRVHGIHRYW